MAKWSSTAESGILRKKVPKDKLEELLVFGYACKLFRDDTRAQFIDQGKHLIPWMGHDTLKIDRYDCRGALSELAQYEANREGFDSMRWLGLNESERRLEQLCDEERYYALKNNEEDEEMYREEELKRLHQKGSEFQYNYDVPTDPEKPQTVENIEPEDEAFVTPLELDVPSDFQVPRTIKENTRIEKTALFISKQGPQMEILIKTKQSDNPQFSFMNQTDPLYKYYKHVLVAIKSGSYKVQNDDTQAEQHHEESRGHDDAEDHYLHPSLVAAAPQPVPVALPPIPYKPSADCAYSQLVTRIQGTQSEAATPPPPEVVQPQATYEQQQQYYQQYYYAAQYYEYYKQMVQQFQAHGQPIPPEQPNITQDVAQMAYAQYMQQQASVNNPYAQIVSNLSQPKEPQSLYANFVAQPAVHNVVPQPNTEITKAPILYSQTEAQAPVPLIGPVKPVVVTQAEETKVVEATPVVTVTPQIVPLEVKEVTPPPQIVVQKPLLSLAQYGSDSEEEPAVIDSEDEELAQVPDDVKEIKTPTQEAQLIIDKMASYVTKNGKSFEKVVKAKGDQRFEFLNENHEFHLYYLWKRKEYKNAAKDETPQEEKKEIQNGVASKTKEKKVVAPVSFSIKKAKEETPKEIKSALPVEESDEELEEPVQTHSEETPSIAQVTQIEPVQNFTPINEAALSENSVYGTPLASPISMTPPPRKMSIDTPVINNSPVEEEAVEEEVVPVVVANEEEKMEEVAGDNGNLKNDDPILEMIDLTDDFEEKRDAKRIKDKLVAKEKIALQLERKRKAAAFLKLKSSESAKREHSSKSERLPSEKRSLRPAEGHHDASKKLRHSVTDSGKKVKESGVDSSSKKARMKDPSDSDEIRIIEDSEPEEGEIKKHKKSSKKKKSHKRKRSKTRQESKTRSRHRERDYKKSKKRRKKSKSSSPESSHS